MLKPVISRYYEVREVWVRGRIVLIVLQDGKEVARYYQTACSVCGTPFHYPAGPGRPPERCEKCRGRKNSLRIFSWPFSP